jgi:hypothetical protein
MASALTTMRQHPLTRVTFVLATDLALLAILDNHRREDVRLGQVHRASKTSARELATVKRLMSCQREAIASPLRIPSDVLYELFSATGAL